MVLTLESTSVRSLKKICDLACHKSLSRYREWVLNIDGAILFLDFTKAFDSVEWEFMYYSMKKFGFNNSIIQWVQTLYTNIKGCILNNGWISSPFDIQRGIRQGCPVSALIFVITVEILACRLRQDNDIKGIQIKLDGINHSIKLSQLADDTTIFVKTREEISKALNIIEIFGSLSGLLLNRNKTEGIWLGNLKHDNEKYEEINWSDTVKCLGVYFGHNKAECKRRNIEKQILKTEKIINDWNKRNLTMLGRITVAKSLLIPNITFIGSVTKLDKTYVSKFKKLIYDFIWNNKQEKVKRSILSLDFCNGGLRATDLDKYLDAIKINWIKRLIHKDNIMPNWKIIPTLYFNTYGQNFMLL